MAIVNAGTSDTGPADEPAKPARGRPRDPARDIAILDAALDVLAEVDYAVMTMDMVAARAKAGKATMYRRWSSKEDLVFDAVAHLRGRGARVSRLPDTGSLRGDMLALFQPHSVEEGQRRLRIMANLGFMLRARPELADAGTDAAQDPWVVAHTTLIQRAVDRGEATVVDHVATVATVLPQLTAFRSMVQQRPFSYAFLVEIVDGVILPALGIRPGSLG